MDNDNTFTRLIRRISMWRTLRLLSIITIVVVVFDALAEAYDLSNIIVWLEQKELNLTWKKAGKGETHYRVEMTKTNLLEEPTTSYYTYDYTNVNEMKIELANDVSYMFRVQSIDDYGNVSVFSDSTALFILRNEGAAKLAASADNMPTEFSLSQNFPNPFNNYTTINYTIPSAAGDRNAKVELVIYNKLGQKVRTMVDEFKPAGSYRAVWDGRDDSGSEMASGHYLYNITMGSYHASKKMIYMK